MSQEKIDLKELTELLKRADFEYIDEEDNPERVNDFLTSFQIKKKLKIPLNNYLLGQAIDFCGLRGFYKGHRVPMNPDETAFTIRYNIDDEPYLVPLFHKRMFSEIEDVINENEQFQEYLNTICDKEKKALLNNDDFWVCDITATAPSPAVGKMIEMAFVKIENNNVQKHQFYRYWINPELSPKALDDYNTPYKEGTLSPYQKTGIALPGMEDAKPSQFITRYQAIRYIYKISKDKQIISAQSDEIEDFINIYFKELNISEEHHFNKIIKNNISIINMNKLITGRFMTPFEIKQHFNLNLKKPSNALEGAYNIADIALFLKQQLKNHL